MSMLTARELLQRHRITFVATKKGSYTTTCPECGGGGYLNVKVNRAGVAWYCHQCRKGGGEKYERRHYPADTDLGPIKKIYDYTDENGKRLFQTLRFEPVGKPKDFRQRTGPEQKKWSIKGVRLVPYRLPELIEAIALNQVVFVVEGEKDALTLAAHNIAATTNPMGAGKWRPEFNLTFRDADVVVCGDNDQPGRDHVQLVLRNLRGAARRLRVLDLKQFWPEIEESNDITDWFEAGGTVEAFWQMVEALPPRDEGEDAARARHDGARKHRSNGGDSSILSKREFIRGFQPPDYLVDGVLQKRFFYALTGATGHAKTAIALHVAQLVGSRDPGAMLGIHAVAKGRVVYMVGENPDDLRMRVIGTDALRDDHFDEDEIVFVPGTFNIADMQAALASEAQRLGGVDLVVVDTSAAYFVGDEELSNTQMGEHARMLRGLAALPGGPCLLVLCHPIKHVVEPSQLLPRGGGAFLAEVDGNLTAWKRDDVLVELHHNKIRGPGFEPITFRLEKITTPKLVDAKGRLIPTVRAAPISEHEEEATSQRAREDEDRLLVAMRGNADRSIADLARACGWTLQSGEPAKSRVHRLIERLEKTKPKLVSKGRGDRWQLTDAGKSAADKAAARRTPTDHFDAQS
jgi:hypothetical protein